MIPIHLLRPTEPILRKSELDRVRESYEKNCGAVPLIKIYADGSGRYLIEEGNKRSVVFYQKGKRTIPAYVVHDSDEVGKLEQLARKAETLCGVSTVADLSRHVYPDLQYHLLIRQLSLVNIS